MMTPKEMGQQRVILTTAHYDYGGGLKAHAFFKLHDSSVSEDLVQDTFVKTWRYLLRGGQIEIMKAFLYHVLNHLIVDQYRKHKTISLDSLMESGYEPNIDETEKLYNIFDGRVTVGLINHLPEKYKKVMRLRYVQDLSLNEIGLITGQSRNTIAVQIHSDRQKIKCYPDP